MSNRNLKEIYDRHCARPIPKTDLNKKSTPSIKPSMLGTPCMRKLYYSYNKAPEDIPFPLTSARITNLGTAIGEMLFNAFDAEGVVVKYTKEDGTYYIDEHTGKVDYEFRLTCPELGVKLGKIDLVLTLDDGLWLGEIKSINERGFKGLKGPKPDHIMQGVLYLYLFNLALKEGKFKHIPQLAKFEKANGIRFLYYWKDKSELNEYLVTSADQIFKNIVLKIEQTKYSSENDILPPPTEDYCQNCTFKFRCAKNKKAHE